MNSLAVSIASLHDDEKREVLRNLTNEQAAELLHEWRFWARPDQLPPSGDWSFWVLQSGRGAGKTRAGAEWVRRQVETGACKRIALVARTAADVRDTMVEGESGIMAICPPENMPVYEPSKRRLTWPNGAIATTYSAEEPKHLRGPQHDGAWCDEVAAWRDASQGITSDTTWSNLMFGLRLGADPRVVITTTPRPVKLFRQIVADPKTVVTRASTYDNLCNLAPTFADKILSAYEGTRLGRQELAGELLEDVEGALWSRELIDTSRVADVLRADLLRIVVAIDPAVTSGEDSDETGIVVAARGADGHGYILADATCKLSPLEWAKRAVHQFDKWAADRIVAEVNNGGDLVEATLRAVRLTIPYEAVHASRGKRVRAEPVSALYEQGRIHHVGLFDALEDQMCNYVPDAVDSPDRLDAMVWAVTALGLVSPGGGHIHTRQSGRTRTPA
jgi:phage terminase large subunit-like protein